MAFVAAFGACAGKGTTHDGKRGEDDGDVGASAAGVLTGDAAVAAASWAVVGEARGGSARLHAMSVHAVSVANAVGG